MKGKSFVIALIIAGLGTAAYATGIISQSVAWGLAAVYIVLGLLALLFSTGK